MNAFSHSPRVIFNFLLLFYFGDFPLPVILGYGFILTLVTTLAELTTLKGFDNMTVPLSAVIALYPMLHRV
jgi:dolichol kinase